ncbi:MAG: hypothetical protein CME70_15740 [Halobacteriovorax sp.]|nr:hypothetical protein [Halobacteriovorax sp.]|tara:strand:- start:12155 stop:13660 length:1506 start_codon:yes stop_codon:yes gene_type:complete
MKKLNIVLNETSIINFPFLWKLVKRYKILSISVPLIAAAYSSYTYMGQNTIYSGKVGFKYVNEASNSPSGMIFSMLGEKTSTLDPTEIISYGNSVDFQYKVADELIRSDQFRKLNFNSIGSRKLKTFESMFKACSGNKDCERDKVARLVGQFYSVNMSNDVIDRYSLTVRSLDHNTTDTLVKVVSKAIQNDRLNQIRYFVTSQVKISEELLEKKKKEVDLEMIKGLLDQQAQFKVKIKTANNRLNSIRQHYFGEKSRLNRLETELSQTKKTLAKKNKSTNSELFKVTEAKKLRERVKQLREDIASIELSFENQNQINGSEITKKLKQELKTNERKLASLGDVEKYGVDESFAKGKQNSKATSEHNYNVIKNQFSKTSVEFEKVRTELEKLTKESTELEVQIKEYQPNLELIKLLEQKLVQLRLAESTIVADLVFDNYQSELSSYKKIAKTKMIFVSIFFSCFLLLFIVILRYIFDGRIYDEYELKNNFEDLEIIGNTPDFH